MPKHDYKVMTQNALTEASLGYCLMQTHFRGSISSRGRRVAPRT